MFDRTRRQVGTSDHHDQPERATAQVDGGVAASPPHAAAAADRPSGVPVLDQFPDLVAAARTGGPAEFAALARFAARQVARYDAVQLRALGALARSRPPAPGDGPGLPFDRSVAVDLAASLGVTVAEAVARLQLAWTLTGRLASVLEALEAGQIDLEQARAVARWSPPKARVAPGALTRGSPRRTEADGRHHTHSHSAGTAGTTGTAGAKAADAAAW